MGRKATEVVAVQICPSHREPKQQQHIGGDGVSSEDNARNNVPSQEIMAGIMSPQLYIRKLQLHRETRGPPESTSVKVELSAPQITALIYVQ